ncbi:hypothetical protein [Phyllobacterium sp. P5_D12]
MLDDDRLLLLAKHEQICGSLRGGPLVAGCLLSTPTGSIANPAVAISLLATPAGASVVAVTLVVVVQIIGGSFAALTVSTIYPDGG